MISTLQLMFLMKTLSSLGKQEKNFNADPTLRDKMCPGEEIEFQTKTRSVVECVQQCSVVSACKSLVFYKGNNTCYGIKTTNAFAVRFTELSGAVFYKDSAAETTTVVHTTTTATSEHTSTTVTPTSPDCDTSSPMVASVSDSQFSASSSISNYRASDGRLNDPNSWTSKFDNMQEYIQVDFQNVRVATAVTTQGETNFDEWVTSYKVMISTDCITYTTLSDGNGNDRVFAGNTDRNTHVTNVIDPSVSLRCLKVNPITWQGRIALRFDVVGCVL